MHTIVTIKRKDGANTRILMKDTPGDILHCLHTNNGLRYSHEDALKIQIDSITFDKVWDLCSLTDYVAGLQDNGLL